MPTDRGRATCRCGKCTYDYLTFTDFFFGRVAWRRPQWEIQVGRDRWGETGGKEKWWDLNRDLGRFIWANRTFALTALFKRHWRITSDLGAFFFFLEGV